MIRDMMMLCIKNPLGNRLREGRTARTQGRGWSKQWPVQYMSPTDWVGGIFLSALPLADFRPSVMGGHALVCLQKFALANSREQMLCG